MRPGDYSTLKFTFLSPWISPGANRREITIDKPPGLIDGKLANVRQVEHKERRYESTTSTWLPGNNPTECTGEPATSHTKNSREEFPANLDNDVPRNGDPKFSDEHE